MQLAYAERDASVIKVIQGSADAEEVAADRAVVQELGIRVKMLQREVNTIRQEHDKLRSLNMRLQEALIERPNSTTFAEVPDGFPDAK